jgi:hypothetical protein
LLLGLRAAKQEDKKDNIERNVIFRKIYLMKSRGIAEREHSGEIARTILR